MWLPTCTLGLVLTLATLSHAALFLTPPQKQWVREGQLDVKLLCKASEKIRACSWNTPYGKGYPLSTGLKAEGGRLVYVGNDNKTECGIMITEIQRKDEGRWTCNVGVVEGEEVKSASGMANVTIAVAPDDVFLVEPFHGQTANVTSGVEQMVTCTAKNAKPSPAFTWTVDGTPLIDHKTTEEEVYIDVAGLSTFSQTLHFTPSNQHANKSLSCSISHPGLDQAVGVHVNLNVAGSGADWSEVEGLPLGGIIGIVLAAIFVLVLLILLPLVYRGKCGGKSDHEKLANELAADENEAEMGPEKADQSATAPADDGGENTNKARLMLLVGRLLARLRPSASSDAPSKADQTVASEFEKVDLTGPADEEEGAEKTDPEKSAEEESAEAAQQTFGQRVRGFLARLSLPRRPAKKDDVEMEDKTQANGVEGDAEKKKEEEQEEKMEELEPEDKEEKEEVKEEVKEEEKKRPGSSTPV